MGERGRERYRARRRSPRQMRSRSWTRVVARATSLVPTPQRGLHTPAREREREWEREREGVGEAFTLATEGVHASPSRVARWARWERRLGMRGKRTKTLSAHFIPVPAMGLALGLLGLSLNRGGLYRMPATVH